MRRFWQFGLIFIRFWIGKKAYLGCLLTWSGCQELCNEEMKFPVEMRYGVTCCSLHFVNCKLKTNFNWSLSFYVVDECWRWMNWFCCDSEKNFKQKGRRRRKTKAEFWGEKRPLSNLQKMAGNYSTQKLNKNLKQFPQNTPQINQINQN